MLQALCYRRCVTGVVLQVLCYRRCVTGVCYCALQVCMTCMLQVYITGMCYRCVCVTGVYNRCVTGVYYRSVYILRVCLRMCVVQVNEFVYVCIYV